MCHTTKRTGEIKNKYWFFPLSTRRSSNKYSRFKLKTHMLCTFIMQSNLLLISFAIFIFTDRTRLPIIRTDFIRPRHLTIVGRLSYIYYSNHNHTLPEWLAAVVQAWYWPFFLFVVSLILSCCCLPVILARFVVFINTL